MISKLTLDDFQGVSYLQSSQLIQTCGNQLTFSLKKPTVVVGPNGAGKSALMTTLALRFLAYYTGVSCFDDNYVKSGECDDWWTKADYYSFCSKVLRYLPGLQANTDNAPAIYYRPNHIPGNYDDTTHAMMCGYHSEAIEHSKATERKSSGQGSRALLERLIKALAGELPSQYEYANWGHGREPIDLMTTRRNQWTGGWEYCAEVLKAQFKPKADAIPLILMDEPEQSLDAIAELNLWDAIAKADCSKMQIIVATHSLYPMMHPNRFNFIEAVPDYVDQVRDLISSQR